MASYTPNYNLYLPSKNDSNIEVDTSLSDNFNEIDTAIHNNATSLTDIANFSSYKFVGDGTTDNLTPFTNLINAYPNGALVYVPPGNYYISDENKLPSLIQKFEFIGIGDAIFTFGIVCGTSTASAPASNTVPNWVRCKFRNITFSAPNATGYAIFTSGSSNLRFYHCTISDVKPLFQQGTGDVCIFHDCKFIAPNTPAGTCLQTIGNVQSRFIVEKCDWNFAPNQGAGSLIAATNASNLIGDYWFLNNRFFTDNQSGYYIDAIIDLEPNNATIPLRNVHIEGNEIWNGKIYMGACEELWVKDNYFHFTSICNGGPSGFPLQGTEAYTTAPLKYLEISNNIVLCDDYAGETYKNPIGFDETNSIEHLVIKGNTLQFNGAQINNPNPQSVILINATKGTINYLDIEDNIFYYTSVPSTKGAAIHFYVSNTATINRVKIKNNRLSGASGAANAFLYQTNGGTAGTIKSIEIFGNDVQDAGLPSFLGTSSNTINSIIIKENRGYNPGVQTSPGIPANGTAVYQPQFNFPCRVYITGCDNVAINGVTTGLGSGTFLLEAGQSITLWYSTGTPSWIWVGIQ